MYRLAVLHMHMAEFRKVGIGYLCVVLNRFPRQCSSNVPLHAMCLSEDLVKNMKNTSTWIRGNPRGQLWHEDWDPLRYEQSS